MKKNMELKKSLWDIFFQALFNEAFTLLWVKEGIDESPKEV